MKCYTVYYSPIDYQNMYVVKEYEVTSFVSMKKIVYVGDSIDEARAYIPDRIHKTRVKRAELDSPSVIETWF